MRKLLGITLGFILLLPTLSFGASCENLRAPHRVSYRGQENKLFDRLIEIVEQNYHNPPATLAVIDTVAACLETAREQVGQDGAGSPFEALAKVKIEPSESGAHIVASLQDSPPRRFPVEGKLSKLASRTVKHLSAGSKKGATPDIDEQIWFLWFHSYMAATGHKYNWYDYADELTEESAEDRGRSFRVGFELDTRDERLVIGAIQDRALADAGLKSGTEFVGFDDLTMTDLTLPEFQRFWYSPEPFTFVVNVRADSGPLRISGRAIPTRHTTLSWAVLGNAGYVRIYRFARDTLIEMRRAMRRLEDEEISGLVLDVRGNSGGALSPGLVDMFLKPGQAVVSYRDHGADEARDLKATVEYYDLPMAILVDRDSASMAEILAAAFVTHERGTVIGEVTVGKGVGQQVRPVLDEGRVHLVGRVYFYPGTRDTWNGEGIQPSTAIALDDESRKRLEPFLASPDLRLEQQVSVDRALQAARQHLEE